MTKKELKQWFEANYLDGDVIQDGQMISSEECFNAVKAAISSLAEEVGRLKEAELPTEWTGRDCIAYKYAIERVLKMMRGE